MKTKNKILTGFITLALVISTGALAVSAATTVEGLGKGTQVEEKSIAESSTKNKATKSKKSSTSVSVTSVAASVLGITEAEIKEAIKTDKVGTLLIAAGKVEAFKTEYLAQTKTKLNACVEAGTLTQEEADIKYTEAEVKMSTYDGSSHLCGGTDHSKIFSKSSSKKSSDTEI